MTYNPRIQFGDHGHRNPGGAGRRGGGPPGRGRNRRALSQNFLHDRPTIQRIVRAARTGSGDLVVEVGGGEGGLTAALAARAGQVVSYEIDPVMAARQRARCRDLANVRCVLGDFLRSRPPGVPFAVVGNIPYSVTAKIVEWCLRAPRLTSATLVTQLEYARKRTGDYGRWSKVTVESWPRFDWELGGRIDRDKFRPVPGVDSAILRLERRGTCLLPDPALPDYRGFVEVGFGGVGGSLHASLRRAFPKGRVDAAFRATGLDRETAVGFVHPDQWLGLFRVVHGLPPDRA
ncbi:rRNA (adenine-N6)-methyltransferase [Actinomadura craniellae]|uniref:rRNA (Adenine-N6)-methyltransferase n=1 Tax=Actinomadura craniellae TaxID=2231787 RepID=A0A365HAS2_9ACTN|nr:ErmE/ErmH/ErmO/ErmR family 23S rRNA (adenine(2058)-N(6))-methyltransferase [Actinomadura craniellae]RAY16195.1 rRNA (adenine-N6)-methyltransferase [Actinomadura craniellae]